MIRITCPGCGVKIKAKLKLAGQTRKCPKCGGKIVVPTLDELPDDIVKQLQAKAAEPGSAAATKPAADKPVEIIHTNPAEARLPVDDLPEGLDRTHRYLICDNSRLRAMWRDDGQGWMVKGVSGFVPARRNTENLPGHGQFTLVELELELGDEGLRLQAITSYKLASRFAMTKLALGDDDILRAVTGPGSLNREQKNAVRQSLNEQFMREVWGDSAEVVDYLGNADYHSSTSRAE